LDIAALQAFVAVADLGSFSAAADRLYVTQPAVSKRIANLETLMSARLFDRIGRQVLLTEAGRTLYPRAHRVLTEIEDGRRDLHNLSGRVEGTLRVATSHHVGLHRLPPVLRRYRARFPQVRLDLRFMASEAAYGAVTEGSVDFAVVTLDPTPRPELSASPLWTDPMLPVAARKSPLLNRHCVRPADLEAEPAILPDSKTFTRRIVDNALAGLGIKPNVELSTNFLETIKMMVSVGLGWSVLPVNMIDRELAVIELPGLEIARPLGAIHHPGRTLSNAARAMLTLLPEDEADARPPA